MTDYKEKIDIYTKYLKKKSKLVGGKYLSLHRWVSQVWIVHFASWICDFTTWRWFLNLEMICHLFRSLKVISQRGSQLRRWSFNLRSGMHVLGGGFAAAKHLAKFRKWISIRSCEMGFGLRNFRSSFRITWCNCLQTAITSSFQLQFAHCLKRWTPDFLSFEKNIVCMKWTPGSTQNVSNSCYPLEFLYVRFLSFSSLHSWLALAKDYKDPKLQFFMQMSFHFLCHGLYKALPYLRLLWWSECLTCQLS